MSSVPALPSPEKVSEYENSYKLQSTVSLRANELSSSVPLYPPQGHSHVISEEDKRRIESVVDKFADYSATDLVTITHGQTPWKNAYRRGQNNEITIAAIKEYFNA